jgi:hypothetical protein
MRDVYDVQMETNGAVTKVFNVSLIGFVGLVMMILPGLTGIWDIPGWHSGFNPCPIYLSHYSPSIENVAIRSRTCTASRCCQLQKICGAS